MEPVPQEPSEPTPLVDPPPQEPVLPSTRIWTYVGGSLALTITILYFVYRALTVSFSVLGLLLTIAWLGLVFALYRFIVFRVGGPDTRHDLVQAYVVCGMWPKNLLAVFFTALFSLTAEAIFGLILYWTRPSWVTRIANAVKELSKHGQLKVGSVPFSSILAMMKSENKLHHTPIRAIDILTSVSPRNSDSSVVHEVVTVIHGVMKMGRPRIVQHGKIAQEIAQMLRAMEYEDGTKAQPLFAEVVRSIGSIPLWSILPFTFILHVFRIFIVLSVLHLFTKISMGRTNVSVRTVTSCAMAISLGSTILPVIILLPSSTTKLGLLSLIHKVPAQILGLAVAALIGMRLFDNSQVVFEDEKRPVLRLPATLLSITALTTSVCLLVALRNMLHLVADSIELRLDLSNVESILVKWLAFAYGVPFLVAVCVTVYAVWVTWSRFPFQRA